MTLVWGLEVFGINGWMICRVTLATLKADYGGYQS